MNNKLEHIVLKYLNKSYGDLKEYRTDGIPNSVFFIKGGKAYIEQDLKNGVLWVDYDTIWKDLKNTFSLNYDEIPLIITKWVKEAYNLRGLTPKALGGTLGGLVEDTYNFRNVTPSYVQIIFNNTVEITY
jgi:hypothetical protein